MPRCRRPPPLPPSSLHHAVAAHRRPLPPLCSTPPRHASPPSLCGLCYFPLCHASQPPHSGSSSATGQAPLPPTPFPFSAPPILVNTVRPSSQAAAGVPPVVPELTPAAAARSHPRPSDMPLRGGRALSSRGRGSGGGRGRQPISNTKPSAIAVPKKPSTTMSTPQGSSSHNQALVAHLGGVPDEDMDNEYHDFALMEVDVSDGVEDGAGSGGTYNGDGEEGGDEDEEDRGEGEDEEEVGSKRKLTSKVWAHFKRVKRRGEWKGKCLYCHKELGGDPKNGTKHLHVHLKACVQKKIKTKDKTSLSQPSLRFGSHSQGKVSVENYTFDQDRARKELAAMLVLHEYPLSIVDHVGFRRFVSALQPLFKMVTRNTIRKDILEFYKAESKKAIGYMAGNGSRVAITTDLWTTDNQKKGYMAITGHFIDESWKLRSIIMRYMLFIYVPAPHTAEVIDEELHESLVAWNLDEKLSTVTVDNCSSNDKTIELLVRKLGTDKLMLKGTLLHMCCCAHILNLIVKDGLDVIKPAIDKIRDSVAFWIATPKRIEKFEEIAKYLKVPITKRLVLDCKTRWNSVFIMLSVAIPYKSVFERAKKAHKQYDSLPTKKEWEIAADIVEKLRLFFEITEMFSGKDYVTDNIYFPKICEIKMKMAQWSSCGNPVIETMTASMNEKFSKYWFDIQGLMGMATLLDPRYKNEMLLVCFAMLHDISPSSSECEVYVGEIVTKLCTLLEEYHLDNDNGDTQPSPSIASMESPALMSLFNARVAQKRPASLG